MKTIKKTWSFKGARYKRQELQQQMGDAAEKNWRMRIAGWAWEGIWTLTGLADPRELCLHVANQRAVALGTDSGLHGLWWCDPAPEQKQRCGFGRAEPLTPRKKASASTLESSGSQVTSRTDFLCSSYLGGDPTPPRGSELQSFWQLRCDCLQFYKLTQGDWHLHHWHIYKHPDPL